MRSQRWLRLTVLILLSGFALHRGGLIYMAGLMSAVLIMAFLWNRTTLDSIQYERSFYFTRGFPGEEIDCSIEIENHKRVPLGWLHTEDRWPLAVSPVDQNLLTSSPRQEEGRLEAELVMQGFHRIKRHFQIRLEKRGVYLIGPATGSSGDPFGLFSRKAQLQKRDKIVVFPQTYPLPDLVLRPRDPYGEQMSRRRLYEDHCQPMGVRDYQPGDGFRRIHWSATARTGELQSRVYQPVSGLDMVVCLNVATFEPQWMGIDPDKIEALVCMAASVAEKAYEQGYRVGLVSNSAIAQSGKPFRISPGRSPGQLPMILEALAGITPIVCAAFDRFLIHQAPKLQYGSTLVIITAVLPPNLCETLLKLKSHGRKIVVVSLADEDALLMPGIDVIESRAFVERVMHD
ncbi:MAG: DUF58 domain-containing protein [Anaerolineales bacterium]|nr:DUF58 domain-containing protein [Anaerolineales bacterium]